MPGDGPRSRTSHKARLRRSCGECEKKRCKVGSPLTVLNCGLNAVWYVSAVWYVAPQCVPSASCEPGQRGPCQRCVTRGYICAFAVPKKPGPKARKKQAGNGEDADASD